MTCPAAKIPTSRWLPQLPDEFPEEHETKVHNGTGSNAACFNVSGAPCRCRDHCVAHRPAPAGGSGCARIGAAGFVPEQPTAVRHGGPGARAVPGRLSARRKSGGDSGFEPRLLGLGMEGTPVSRADAVVQQPEYEFRRDSIGANVFLPVASTTHLNRGRILGGVDYSARNARLRWQRRSRSAWRRNGRRRLRTVWPHGVDDARPHPRRPLEYLFVRGKMYEYSVLHDRPAAAWEPALLRPRLTWLQHFFPHSLYRVYSFLTSGYHFRIRCCSSEGRDENGLSLSCGRLRFWLTRSIKSQCRSTTLPLGSW